MVRVAIIGASGYTGAESIRILLRHHEAEPTYLTALPEECGPAEEVFPEFRGRCDLPIEPLDFDKLAGAADVALCCLPHKVSMQFVPKLLAAGVKVIDFSADYRLKDVDVYEKYYQPHTDVDKPPPSSCSCGRGRTKSVACWSTWKPFIEPATLPFSPMRFDPATFNPSRLMFRLYRDGRPSPWALVPRMACV